MGREFESRHCLIKNNEQQKQHQLYTPLPHKRFNAIFFSHKQFNPGEKMTDQSKEVSGIGGWLLLVTLGLIISPIRVGHLLLTTYSPIFSNGAWETLTTPGSEAYHPSWAPMLIFEVVGNIGIMALAGITLWHLFRKSKRTPKLAIAWLSWALIFIAVDFFAADLIPVVAAQNDTDDMKELARTLISATIWIPYFLVSKRVKATFVR